MAEISGFKVEVQRNSSVIGFKSVSVSYESGKIGSNWNIDLEQPIEFSSSDTWSIIIEFAGYRRYLVKNALAENYGGEDAFSKATTKVGSSSSDASDGDILSDYGIPKTLYFISRSWLKRLDPSAYIDGQTGVVMTQSSSGELYYREAQRLYHPRLPGKNLEAKTDGTYDFECLYADSHHEIFYKLCRMIGVKGHVNTPDIELADTCSFESGTLWFDVIKRNFTIWSPQINVFIDSEGNQTIVIEDILSQSGATGGLQTIKVNNPAMVSLSRGLTRPSYGSDKLVDHVIIKGRKTQDTYIGFEDRPDYTPVTIPAVEVDPTYCITTRFEGSNITQHKNMGSYEGDFGIGEEKWSVKPIVYTTKQLCFKIERKGNEVRRLLVKEYDKTYDTDGLVAKTETKHYYSPDLQKIVKTVEEYYYKTPMPASSNRQMKLLRTKTTIQQYYVRQLNMSLTQEFIEDVVIYEEVATTEGGSPTVVKDDPKPLLEALRSDPNYVDTDPNTQQKTLEMTTYAKFTHINRCDEHTLIKTEEVYNLLSRNLPSINSQILDNPHKDPPVSEIDREFRREYKDPRSNGKYINGKGPFYHPAKIISHDDICTDAIAEALAERVWYRKNMALIASLWDISVNCPVPVPLDYTSTKIRLPKFSRKVGSDTISFSGGDFLLKKVSYDIGMTKKSNNTILINFSEKLDVGSQL